MFSIVIHIRSRRGIIARKGHFLPRVPVRAAGAVLVAAGAAASGVIAAGTATAATTAGTATAATTAGTAAAATTAGLAAAATGPARHRNPPPAFAQTLTVTTLANAGPGTLRAAITAANTSLPGRLTLIRFAVRGTITLSGALPAITRGTTINGATAPGYRHAPVVEIDANGQAGLEFAPGSSGSALLALAVDGAGGDGVTLEAGNITLDGNYIGLSLSGAAAGNQGDGVFVAGPSNGNTIGGNPAGRSGAVSNVISGNAGNGITLSGSSLNTVQDNRIGTGPAAWPPCPTATTASPSPGARTPMRSAAPRSWIPPLARRTTRPAARAPCLPYSWSRRWAT